MKTTNQLTIGLLEAARTRLNTIIDHTVAVDETLRIDFNTALSAVEELIRLASLPYSEAPHNNCPKCDKPWTGSYMENLAGGGDGIVNMCNRCGGVEHYALRAPAHPLSADRELLQRIVADANKLAESVSLCGATVTVKFEPYNLLMRSIVEAEWHLEHPDEKTPQ